MKNPIITLDGSKVLADGKPIAEFSPDDLNKNIVFFYSEEPGILWPAGWFFLNLCDTPETAQEVAKGGNKDKNLPIVFFPGSLGRQPNFPKIWKEKKYHPGIIAAVQGQFRGGTKLHIEYMSVKPSYRRNKVMDKLITFLEEYFEPKTKEFHELTKDGKAFVKGTKRNPYPDDNTLPDDFKANVPDWNFKLNIKGVSDDFFDPVSLAVMNGFLFGHVEGDGEKYAYEIGNVAVMLVRPYKFLPVKHSTQGNLRGYIRNVDAIIREIIEKGMKQEGYKPTKKNPLKINRTMDDYPRVSVEGIAYYDIDPLEFLRLTAESPEHFHMLLKKAKPLEFYNQPEVNEDMVVHPFLAVDENGKIDAHEGRHRAAATYNAGEKTYRIAIVAEERGWPVAKHGWRWKRRLSVPPTLIAQYPGMERYEHKVDASKLEEIPTYYEVDNEGNEVRRRRKKTKVKTNPMPKLEFEEVE